MFVTSGGLKKIQEIRSEPGSALQEHIHEINKVNQNDKASFNLF